LDAVDIFFFFKFTDKLLFTMCIFTYGPGRSVGVASGYGLNGPGIEFRLGARYYAHVQTGPGAHPASCTMGAGSFLGVKRPGRDADHTLPSKHRGHERVELYLDPPWGPVQACNGAALLLPCIFTYVQISDIEVFVPVAS
jgi:hypothetical protein